MGPRTRRLVGLLRPLRALDKVLLSPQPVGAGWGRGRALVVVPTSPGRDGVTGLQTGEGGGLRWKVAGAPGRCPG